MINYFKMKRNEWKVKAQFYGMVAHLIDNQKDIIAMIQKLYTILKDVPAEELRTEFVVALAKIAHQTIQTDKKTE